MIYSAPPSSLRQWIVFLLLPVLFFSGCATPEQRAERVPIRQAQHSLKRGRAIHLSKEVRAGYYLDAADTAASLFNRVNTDKATAAAAQVLYNTAAAELTALLKDSGRLWKSGLVIPSQEGKSPYLLRIQQPGRLPGVWAPGYFTEFKPADEVSVRGIRRHVTESGFGGALVGIRDRTDLGELQERFATRSGITAPVTATLDFAHASSSSGNGPSGKSAKKAGVRNVTLTLVDPSKQASLPLLGETRPLAADFTAPLAYYPRRSEFWAGLLSMIQVEKYISDTGLYMLQPYDPQRLPVIFVHGLASTPMMWINVINEIEADPVLRGRCQYWVVSYPSGTPVSYSAMRLREDLAVVQKNYPIPKGFVLVGHSMGGIVARMQATTTGRVLWDANLKGEADKLYKKLPPDSLLKRLLIFDADPDVKRLVFICVPHRGSDLAVGSIGEFFTRLITLPTSLISGVTTALGSSLDVLLGPTGDRWPTSIQSLSPNNPSLLALNKLPIRAPFNSIIGDRGKGNTPNSSDGVVPYWSSHLEGADSELIVPGPHGSYQLPQTIAELRRILLKQLNAPEPANRKEWVN